MSVYNLDNLGMVYGENHALKNLSLSITQRSLGLIGKSGSGKTTLLRILSGLQSQTSGDLYFKEGKAKVLLGLCRGKELHDKRHAMKTAEAKRDMARQMLRRR